MSIQDKLFKEITNSIIKHTRTGVDKWQVPWDEVATLGHQLAAFEPIPAAEHIIESTGAEIDYSGLYGSGTAYNNVKDLIKIPPREIFKSPLWFYSAVFHELAHWAGHESRLNRLTMGSTYQVYRSIEEMTAEFTAAFILGTLGLNDIERHASYIVHHFNAGIYNDMESLNFASLSAKEAAEYILGMAE